jgi:UDP-N-acetylmuramoyl-L-alanyl-D-glutamate--2,6-diaminopimelate ligase
VVHSGLDFTTMGSLQDIARRRKLDLRSVGPHGTAIRMLRAVPRAGGQTLELLVSGARREVELPLAGLFQADNALLAAGLALAVGETGVIERLSRLTGVRGRMELVATLANGAAAYVDYAHTPDALERLLAALRPHTTGRLVVVFGAGGDRDPGKRPLMGAAAAHGADALIVTDDNPRSEDPAAIRAAVMGGVPAGIVVHEIGDRAAAIAAGLNALGAGDVLVVAGKGHEQGQIVGRTVLPFDDASVVRGLVGA